MNTPAQQQRPPGFNCPQCRFFIEVSLESLLYDDSQKCPQCKTVFSMDRSKSKDALQLIQKLHVAMKNMETVKEFKPGK